MLFAYVRFCDASSGSFSIAHTHFRTHARKFCLVCLAETVDFCCLQSKAIFLRFHRIPRDLSIAIFSMTCMLRVCVCASSYGIHSLLMLMVGEMENSEVRFNIMYTYLYILDILFMAQKTMVAY